ncbi:hypothetical protein Pcinc_033258 [Petrolisthes cinctipes]|uniref:Uncharacterized protein n=1 Tax=Petrolisthes cinctipes TaxID=88211 RepID=A0AAE1ESR7_PETCI|nr:hypothetical protein Pcinc_033258 [Petrolisthes cinctipes]
MDDTGQDKGWVRTTDRDAKAQVPSRLCSTPATTPTRPPSPTPRPPQPSDVARSRRGARVRGGRGGGMRAGAVRSVGEWSHLH